MGEVESQIRVNLKFFEEDRYLFPDKKLLIFSSDDLHRVILDNLTDANDHTDGTDCNSDVRIDFAQDIVEQARDILLARGKTFTDEEKCEMHFLSWPLTEEEIAQEAIKSEQEQKAMLRVRELWRSTVEKYTPWLEILVQGKMPTPEADFSTIKMRLGVSALSSGETNLPTWTEVCKMKDELQTIANLEVDAGYSGFYADMESNRSCFWSFWLTPPSSPQSWSLLQKWWKEGRYTSQPELWEGEVHWTLDCWPKWGTAKHPVAEIGLKERNSGCEGIFEESVSILTNLLDSHNVTSIEAKSPIAVNPAHAETYTLSESECLAKWNARSLRYRAQHRKNVIVAFLLGRITFDSFVRGLRSAPRIEYLACIRPERGIIAVCPERIAENNSIFADFD